MPVLGMKAGELTANNFAFFTKGKILDFPAEKLDGTPGDSERIAAGSRGRGHSSRLAGKVADRHFMAHPTKPDKTRQLGNIGWMRQNGTE